MKRELSATNHGQLPSRTLIYLNKRETVLTHFDENVVFTSPTAAAMIGAGTVRGKKALRAFLTAALERVTALHVTVDHVLWDPNGRELAIVYEARINDQAQAKRVSEHLRFDQDGRVISGEVFSGVVSAGDRSAP